MTERPPTGLERLERLGMSVAMTALWPFSLKTRSNVAGGLARRVGPRLRAAARIEGALRERMPELAPDARRRIARGVFENFARTTMEYSDLPSLYAAAPRYEIVGAEHLAAAHAAAGGRLMVVSAHYGNWEAIRAAALLHGVPLGLMYRAFNNPFFERAAHRNLASVGLPAFQKGSDGARRLLRHVLDGGGALILVDQRLGGAPLIDFMGAPAETSIASARLSLRTGAPLLPAYARRVDDGFAVVFEPPIAPAAPNAMMAEVNRRIGAWIRADPAQWLWLHRRWRVRDVERRARHRKLGDDEPVENEAAAGRVDG